MMTEAVLPLTYLFQFHKGTIKTGLQDVLREHTSVSIP